MNVALSPEWALVVVQSLSLIYLVWWNHYEKS